MCAAILPSAYLGADLEIWASNGTSSNAPRKAVRVDGHVSHVEVVCSQFSRLLSFPLPFSLFTHLDINTVHRFSDDTTFKASHLSCSLLSKNHSGKKSPSTTAWTVLSSWRNWNRSYSYMPMATRMLSRG